MSMRGRVCLGTREGRPGGLRQSVGPSRFRARFHLGFPKSSEVGMSSYSLAASPFAQSLEDRRTSRLSASYEGPAARVLEVSWSTCPLLREATRGPEGWEGQVTGDAGAESGPEPCRPHDPTPTGSLGGESCLLAAVEGGTPHRGLGWEVCPVLSERKSQAEVCASQALPGAVVDADIHNDLWPWGWIFLFKVRGMLFCLSPTLHTGRDSVVLVKRVPYCGALCDLSQETHPLSAS